MKIVSQISGKYSIKDNGIFLLKKKLLKAGITIKFPEGDKILSIWKNIPITFFQKKGRTFYEVEKEFFLSIKKSNSPCLGSCPHEPHYKVLINE